MKSVKGPATARGPKHTKRLTSMHVMSENSTNRTIARWTKGKKMSTIMRRRMKML